MAQTRLNTSQVPVGTDLQIDQKGGTASTYGTLTGLINGSNTDFTVSLGSYPTGKLTVEIDGQLQTQGTNEDWVELSPAAGTFRFNTAPPIGSIITAIYGRTATVTGTVNWGDIGGSILSQADLQLSLSSASPSTTLLMRQLLGSAVVAETIPLEFATTDDNVGGSGTLWYQAIYLPARTVNGFVIHMDTAGVFTGNNENAIALYSYSAGTLTKVATTSNDANIWKSLLGTKALTSPYVAAAGIYFIGGLWNWSASTTNPRIKSTPNNSFPAFASANSAGLGMRKGTGNNVLPTTDTVGTISTSNIYMGVY